MQRTRKSSRKLVLKVVKDYYNGEYKEEVVKGIFGQEVKDDLKSDIFKIKHNLDDKKYINSF